VSRTSARRTGMVYVMTNQTTGNGVTVFARAANGSLTEKGTFPTGGLGGGSAGNPNDPLTSQGSLVLSKDHRFLFAVDAGSDELTVMAVNGDQLTVVDHIPSGATTTCCTCCTRATSPRKARASPGTRWALTAS
jgi:6-phosphogluconolactonase